MSPTILEGAIVLLLVSLLAAYVWLLVRLWRQRRAEQGQITQQQRLPSNSEPAARLQNGAAAESIPGLGEQENVKPN